MCRCVPNFTPPPGVWGILVHVPAPPCLESQGFQFDLTFLWFCLVLLPSPVAFYVMNPFSAIGPLTCPLFHKILSFER